MGGANTNNNTNNGDTRKPIFGEMQITRKGGGRRLWFRPTVIYADKKNGDFDIETS